MTVRVPHPFPYQGSKRSIASLILPYIPQDTEFLIEPFCGSAAISIAAAARGLVGDIALNDINPSLIKLWSWILERPSQLVSGYEELWNEQHTDHKGHFFKIRDQFNSSHEPHHFLYLLARIVKGSVRYSAEGNFNQSPDNRRSGMHPSRMRREIMGVSQLLSGRTSLSSLDFREAANHATTKDVLYLDPPYQGISFTRDHRYYDGLSFNELVDALSWMNARGLSFMVSYDGQTGEKQHGRPLPQSLRLAHLHIFAGRSSQATLLGFNSSTVESLYLSHALVQRLQESSSALAQAVSIPSSRGLL